MKKRLISTYTLSLFDIVATCYLSYRFGDVELNPLMAAMLSTPIVALLYKVFVVGGGLFALYKLREYKAAVGASWVVFAVYALLAGYHVVLISTVHNIMLRQMLANARLNLV